MSFIGNILMGAGAVVTTVCLAPFAVGFGTAGVVGGTIAAGIQSTIGNVVAGSLFAATQSLVMGGTATALAGAGAIATGTGIAIDACTNKKPRPKF